MNTNIFLLLGGNLGDRLSNLSTARSAIEENVGNIVQASSIYRTAAWGKTDQPDFYNQVIQITSALSPVNLLSAVLSIEESMGRERLEKWGTRKIDIDILFYNDIQLHIPTLRIPHPEIQNRKFTLVPLLEIAGNFIHPVLQKNIAQLLLECPDNLPVEKVIVD